MPKPNDRIGPYQLIRKLGEGGFGEVWLAQDSSGSGSHEVAVKMPLKSEIDFDALLQEATLWARATGHANVLEFLAARVFDGQVVLVSEYAPGGSLEDWLERHGGSAPSVEAALEMTRGILAGLEHLHSRGIIHRDIKPDNVLLLRATPRLADFGISRVLKSTHKSTTFAGTYEYMAPETFNRKRNQQTDLWSVGVMLYQMLGGRLPFEGDDLAEIYGAIRNEEPKPLPISIPEWLHRVVVKSLMKEPERRYQTAAEMRAALTPHKPTVRENPPQPEKPLPSKRPPTVAESPSPKPLPVVAPPPKPEPVVVKPQPQSAKSGSSLKWGLALAAAIVAVTIYVMTQTTSPDSSNSTINNQTLPSSGDEFTDNLKGVNLAMKRLPGGSFLMGSPENEEGRFKDESPQHRVTVPSFYIGKTEVTQAQWKVVMGSNPSNFKGDDLPVESISWNDAKAFCQKLSEMTGKAYRLPSEAEWEYACRAGTTVAYAGDLDAMAWYSNNAGNKMHPVGQKQANRFGLFDMHGNVYEWCEDVWHESYGGQNGNPPVNGSAWLSGGDSSRRVLRGGSWNGYGVLVRSAIRSNSSPGNIGNLIGFRVVCARTPNP